MGNQVNMVAIKYLNNRRWDADAEKSAPLVIGLTEGQHAKLTFLARRFGDTEAAVASRLLNGAMEDCLRVVGSHEAFDDEVSDTAPPEQQNRVIDELVNGYREEILRILYEKDTP
jgi:hypothetical protein